MSYYIYHNSSNGYKDQKGLGGYLEFTEPIALLTPLNVIGELANPIIIFPFVWKYNEWWYNNEVVI